MNPRGNEDKHAKAAGRVLRQLRLVFHTFKAHFRQIERDARVSGAQLWALSVVNERPGIRLGELARALDIRQSTASNLIKPLVEGGFVVTAKHETDRRIVELRLSNLGRTVVRKAPPPQNGVLPNALGKLSGDALLRLEADLDQLIEVLGSGKRGARMPLGMASGDD